MSIPRPRVVTTEENSGSLNGPVETLDLAVEQLRRVVDSVRGERRKQRANPALIPGGVVLVTEDGLGVARAVVADLKALGHPVIRIRHGIGDGPIEGVNLTSAASVAALIERARERGPVAAIVHAAPLGGEQHLARAWNEPDNARTLALLTQASAEDLKSSAHHGGSCLIVAQLLPDRDPILTERIDRWVEISARSLKGVRVRSLSFQEGGEREVIAAEIVRAVLGADQLEPIAGQVGMKQDEQRPILLGAPDRACWIHLASALADWLDDSSNVRLADLAFTLHPNQPRFPFRVGIVADSAKDLSLKLQKTIWELADPTNHLIHDLSGTYWFDPAPYSFPVSRLKKEAGFRGNRRIRRTFSYEKDTATAETVSLESLLARTSRHWLNHALALEFARNGTIHADLFEEGSAHRLDFSLPHVPAFDSATETGYRPHSSDSRSLVGALDALDLAIQVRQELLLQLGQL